MIAQYYRDKAAVRVSQIMKQVYDNLGPTGLYEQANEIITVPNALSWPVILVNPMFDISGDNKDRNVTRCHSIFHQQEYNLVNFACGIEIADPAAFLFGTHMEVSLRWRHEWGNPLRNHVDVVDQIIEAEQKRLINVIRTNEKQQIV